MPKGPPPFDLIRAAFWLLAAVVGVQLFMMLLSVIGCGVYTLRGLSKPGDCIANGVAQLIHDWQSEILTAILALLVARGPPPPSPPTGDRNGNE